MQTGRWDFAREVRTAVEDAGLRLADTADSPGVRVVPVAAGVRIHWDPGQLALETEPRALDDIRLSLGSALAGLLGQLGYQVLPGPGGGDLLVRPKPRAAARGGAAALWGA